MIELNNENKAKFFALYFGQKVLYDPSYAVVAYDQTGIFTVSDCTFDGVYIEPHVSLILKPLSQITDEDAIEVAKLIENNHQGIIDDTHRKGLIHWGKVYAVQLMRSDTVRFNMRVYNCIALVDYLRSKGYALSWNGLTVEQMVESNWIKLRKEEV